MLAETIAQDAADDDSSREEEMQSVVPQAQTQGRCAGAESSYRGTLAVGPGITGIAVCMPKPDRLPRRSRPTLCWQAAHMRTLRGTEPLLEGSRRGQGFPEERTKWPEAFNRSIARG